MAWQVAHELARQGEAVTVVARELDPAAREAGIALRAVDSPGRRSPLRTLGFSRAAARATPRDEFDVVHGFARTRHQDLYRAGGGSHADHLERTCTPLGRAYRRWLPRHASLLALEQRVFADPRQRIQCASRLVADRLRTVQGVEAGRLWLVPNAVDAARFERARHAEAGARLRQSLAPRAGRIWLFPGSGWHRKGLDLCLSALAQTADREAELWVAGRDAPRAWLRRATAAGVDTRVRFLGPRDDLPIVYAAVDGVLLPTRYDPFANVTFEAAAAGLPVVTSDANGAAEWLSREACVRLEATDREEHVAGLAAAMAALRDPGARARMGGAARREVARFDWPGHVALLRAEYERIVEARRARAGGP